MATIVTRAGKGSPLTHNEVDANFNNLNSDKLEASNNLSDLNDAATAVANLGITASASELNTLDGITATTAELNILDGVTATAAEINQLDGNTFTADITIPDKIIHAGDTNTSIRFPAADTVTVETAGSERVRVDSSGTLGLGVTPSAWDTAFGGRFQLGTQGVLASTSTSSQIGLNWYYDGGYRYIGTGAASRFYQFGGDFVFENAASGTAGNFFNFTQRMSIDSSGVTIVGSLSKGSGSFKIDHPIKPETHHLVHSFIEGPQADNIYRGKVALVGGKATVNLDQAARMTEGTFVALNGNVQCFTSNEDGWTAVCGTVNGNILTIEAQDATCTDTVSWLVIGERHDQHMIDTNWTDGQGRVITEPEKEAAS